MKRSDPDVFLPPTAEPATPPTGKSSVTPPGPSPEWSARGVIDALEPLLTEERRERLRDVLSRRLESVTAVLDNPHDPHNGSAIIRSCEAFGVQTLHLLCEEKEFLTSTKVTKGAHRWVDLVEHRDAAALVERLKTEGFHIVVTHPDGRLGLEDLAKVERLALVLGNEHRGVGEILTAAADDTVSIEMAGFVESLNVSVSAALCLRSATSGRTGDLRPDQQDDLYARWLRATVPRADDVLAALPAT